MEISRASKPHLCSGFSFLIAITIQEHLFMAGFKGTIARHKAQQIPIGISSICNAVKRVLKTRQKWVFLSRDGYSRREHKSGEAPTRLTSLLRRLNDKNLVSNNSPGPKS
jgi:hypothetical protein